MLERMPCERTLSTDAKRLRCVMGFAKNAY